MSYFSYRDPATGATVYGIKGINASRDDEEGAALATSRAESTSLTAAVNHAGEIERDGVTFYKNAAGGAAMRLSGRRFSEILERGEVRAPDVQD